MIVASLELALLAVGVVTATSVETHAVGEEAQCDGGSQCQETDSEGAFLHLRTRQHADLDVSTGHQTLAWIRHYINITKYPKAVCLNGSPGVFYTLNATWLTKKKWIIFYNGGGWCSTNVPYDQVAMVQNCYNRSLGALGDSSNQYAFPPAANQSTWEGALSPYKKGNALLYDFFKVVIGYCDGGSYSGRRMKPYLDKEHNATLYFRGGFIQDAIIQTLKEEYGLMKAEEAVIYGQSAGGLAVYLHANQWRKALPERAFVVGLPECGFFLDWDASKPDGAAHTFAEEMRFIFQEHRAKAGGVKKCVEAKEATGGDVASCMFAQHSLPYVSVPIFALQSVIDAWQVNNILGVEHLANASCLDSNGQCYSCVCYPSQIKKSSYKSINTFRFNLTETLAQAMGASPLTGYAPNPQNVTMAWHHGTFASSCSYHCNLWNQIKIGKSVMDKAVAAWYRHQHRSFKNGFYIATNFQFFQEHEYPCTPNLCCNGPYPQDP